MGTFSRGLCTLVLRRRWPWRYAQRITFGPLGTVDFLVGAITAHLHVGRSYPTIIGAARLVALAVLVPTIIETNYAWRITVPTWARERASMSKSVQARCCGISLKDTI